jgi:RNA polymerase sigma-70 factor (ECF subfamily)
MKEVSFKNDILPLKDVLFRLAVRITLNREDAEDIVQETLIRLWKESQQQQIENIKSYALTICRNLSLDQKAKKEHQTESFDEEIHDQLDQTSSPDRMLENEERFGFLQSLIDELPEKQRTAIQLRDIEGQSYKDIATVMNISESDVKVNIFRARQKLKERLKSVSQ